MNKTHFLSNLRLIAALLICSTTLIACGTTPGQPRIYSYQINWDVGSDARVYGQPDVKVLDFSYGIANQVEIIPEKSLRKRFRADGCCDAMPISINAPRGDYIYFKWRVLATGQVVEDRVDLSNKLPQDMNNKGLYVAIFGAQLYVYLFPPMAVKKVNHPDIVIPGGRPVRESGRSLQDTLLESSYANKYQVYP